MNAANLLYGRRHAGNGPDPSNARQQIALERVYRALDGNSFLEVVTWDDETVAIRPWPPNKDIDELLIIDELVDQLGQLRMTGAYEVLTPHAVATNGYGVRTAIKDESLDELSKTNPHCPLIKTVADALAHAH